MTNKIKILANKYGYPLITGINTVSFIQAFLTLLTPAATPFTAFWAVFTGLVSVMGWMTIAYEYQMNKVRNAVKLSIVENDNKKAK